MTGSQSCKPLGGNYDPGSSVLICGCYSLRGFQTCSMGRSILKSLTFSKSHMASHNRRARLLPRIGATRWKAFSSTSARVIGFCAVPRTAVAQLTSVAQRQFDDALAARHRLREPVVAVELDAAAQGELTNIHGLWRLPAAWCASFGCNTCHAEHTFPFLNFAADETTKLFRCSAYDLRAVLLEYRLHLL